MALVTSDKLLLDAQKGGYAVGAFNVENMEMVMAVVAAAEEMHAHHPADDALYGEIRGLQPVLWQNIQEAKNQEELYIVYSYGFAARKCHARGLDKKRWAFCIAKDPPFWRKRWDSNPRAAYATT